MRYVSLTKILTLPAVLLAACAVGEGDMAAGTGPTDDLPADAILDDAVTKARICATGETVEGIDVSYFQGKIDWSAVAASGRQFAIARVSDGTTFMDPRFRENWDGIRDAGMMRGAYQFFRPAQSATAQADIMIDAVGTLGPGDLPPVVDVEVADGQSSATIVSKLQTWLDRVESAVGRKPMIYAASGFWNTIQGTGQFAGYPLWVANYGVSCPQMPNTWNQWTMWQYTDTGRVSGISGNVDLNQFQGTLAELQALAGIGDSDPEVPGDGPGDDPVFGAVPMGVAWTRLADGGYDLQADAPADVHRVAYYVDGFAIGSADRANGESFAARYRFTQESQERFLEAIGYGADGAEIARAIGLIDVTSGVGVYIRQTGERTYEIGLERAPSAVAAIEVTADGFLLTDGVSQTAHSSRLAVRSAFNQLGPREFAINTFNADGSYRGTLRRTFTLVK